MKIGVLSDTHIADSSCKLPAGVLEAFKDCNLIVHAGDLIHPSCLEALKGVSKVEAVRGNMDPFKVRSLLPDKKILKVAGKKICLMHGYGNPDNLISLLRHEFLAEKPDIIIFGHSHVPMNKYIDGILFFNPGSAMDTVFAPYRSYGIIEIKNGKIEAEIRKL